ncbi:hypothetical protein [Micromonospora sp. NPDC049645]|uniref:hypothetical protein n=1 Tax=Micromonospora sp. NPDC049645 TaxID=3155508 RepID=UPI00342C4D37
MTEQSDIYSGFIEAELKTERERKSSLDTRAASLVTTSGSLVTILAAVGTFLGKGDESAFPRKALVVLVLALAAFSFASLAGILSGWSRPYLATDTEALRVMLNSRWGDDERLARREIASVNIRFIDSLRRVNQRKEWFLRAGWVCQVIALGLLSAVVLIVLATR